MISSQTKFLTIQEAVDKAHSIISHAALKSKTPKPITPYRIKLKSTGHFITTQSGKTIWKTKGHAKSALRYELTEIFRKEVRQGNMDYKSTEQATQEFMDTLVEYVPCNHQLL